MASIIIRDMEKADEYFVSTCSHVNESAEIDACGQRRRDWFRKMHDKGFRAKVALVDDEHAGFLYSLPIEQCPWSMSGCDLLVVPCLYVLKQFNSKGLGRGLIAAVEEQARAQKFKGVVLIGYEHDFWFMPAPFFEKLGFTEAKRKDNLVIMWKLFDNLAQPPEFNERNYQFKSVPGKVVVDLFWLPFCQTSNSEAQRVREVVEEFPDSVVLNEYCADDFESFREHQIGRAIYVNGDEIGWGYEAPKDGIRDAISKALNS